MNNDAVVISVGFQIFPLGIFSIAYGIQLRSGDIIALIEMAGKGDARIGKHLALRIYTWTISLE